MWSPSWKRRCVSEDVIFLPSCTYKFVPEEVFFSPVDPELNMHCVWRPKASGFMVEDWDRSGA